jgi:hypothetical protein
VSRHSPSFILFNAMIMGIFDDTEAKLNEINMQLAESVGFEPTVRFHVHTLSKRAP